MSAARMALLVLLVATGARAQEAAPSQADHAHMDQAQMDQAAHAPQPNSERSPVPPLTAADRAAALPPQSTHDHHDNQFYGYLLVDRLEYRDGNAGNSVAGQAKGWYGTDLNRLWLRLESERAHGVPAATDAELLYGHSISPWWDVIGGVRQHFGPGDDRTSLALGLQGLAPQRFEIAATAFIDAQRRTAARLEVEYKLLFTNRLALQHALNLWLHGRDDTASDIGSGLSTLEGGLRLRYEFTRRFAPYLGLEYERAFGRTASLHRAAGTTVSEARFVMGLRTWF